MVTTNIQSFSGNVEVAGTLSVTGNLISTTGVDKVDLSTDTTNALRPVIFSTGTTGSQSLKTDPGITYNPSTKTFTLTDNITASNATVSDYLIHKDNTNTYLGFPADDTIAFTTGGGEKVRITSTGNLGVGSAAPAYKLHVVGNTYVTSNLTVGTANLHVDTLTGNVGIGTTTPIFTLDVHGTSNVGALTATTVNATTFTGSMSQSLSNGSYLTGDAYDGSVARTFAVDATTDSTANKIVARDASGNVYADRLFTADYLVHEGDINTYFGFPSNDTITFTTTGDERMRVDQYGNVAIGTTSAPYKLNVAGTANVGALSATTVTFSDDLAVGTNKFFVDVSSSNVGIGTSEPAYTLDVTGPINLTSNIVMSGEVFIKAHDATSNHVAIGPGAGQTSQGTNAVAVGYLAGQTNQHDNTVVLNASGSALDTEGTGRTYIKPLRVATVASNVMTYDQTTGEVMDSGGLISNKFAVVSEQPPSALTGATTTIQGHGKYVVASSTGTAYNAFDKSTGVWTSGATYNASTGAYTGAVDLGGAQTVSGEWLSVEFPYKTTLRHVTVLPGSTVASFPGTASIYGTNDNGTTWTSLASWSGETAETTSTLKTFTVNAVNDYKKYALVVNATSAGSTTAQVGELRLFTESFSVDGGIVTTTAASGLETGFTEHPVAPMTDYNTYVEGHGTYEADASSKSIWFHPTLGSPFDYVIGNNMWESSVNWSSSNVYNNTNWTTDVGGTQHYGEWLQLKLPYSIILAYSEVYPRTSFGNRGPGQGVILGSNDGEHWYKITEFSGKTYTNGVATIIDVNATTPYQYFRMTVNKLANATSNNKLVNLSEWRLFSATGVTKMDNVLISGELAVHGGALQTSHIKWPKVPLKANESEGYVASASSEFNAGDYAAWHAFEDKGEYIQVGTSPAWASGNGSFSSGSAQTSRTTGSDTFNHEWLQIQLPQAIQLSYFNIDVRPNRLIEHPKSGFMYGSNDGVTWTKLVAYSDLTYVDYQPTRVNVQSTTPYTYYRLAVTVISGSQAYVGINELQLFESTLGVGTSATTAKLTVDGGLGLAKGSQVFAGSDVVMELPKHDRPLTKYPEVAMTAATTGGYTASASSVLGTDYSAWKAFGDDIWISASSYDISDGTYTGSTTFEGVDGNYLKLEMPKSIKLKHVKFQVRESASTNPPNKGRIYGSNDDSTWFQLLAFDDLNIPTHPYEMTLTINSTEYYKYYVFLVEEATISSTNQAYVSLKELQYYGYEEGDTSVDVVHRSIPNTPGTQQLAVYYEARDPNSYSFADSTKVYDLSGSGVTGTLTGVGYDAEYNSFDFSGVADSSKITATLPSTFAGNQPFTVSVWFKRYNDLEAENTIWRIGPRTDEKCLALAVNGGNFNFFGNDSTDGQFTSTTFNNGGYVVDRWYHVACIYDGSSRYIFIDSVRDGTTVTNSLNFNASTELVLGFNGVDKYLNGSIANFRLFSKVLNADQVRELYDYDAERFGHRQNLVALHKGNLGVGVPHPTSRFEVAGADGLQEYPPKAMTGYETYMEGHGVFRTFSPDGVIFNSSYGPWYAFDKNVNNVWVNDGKEYDTDGTYIGGENTGIINFNGNGTFPDGPWVGIEMPYKTKIESFVITSRANSQHVYEFPRKFSFYGTNGSDTWTLLKIFDNVSSPGSGLPSSPFYVYSDTYYSKYVFIWEETQGGDTIEQEVTLSNISLFGTPAPSSLEDGHLTLGKALTLPRVSGHPAGAETPRAESLVVHYDTTVDSVVSGSTVVDISGTGINGTLTNGAAYSLTDRALTFDGVDDYVSGTLNNPAGAWVHSSSFWVKLTGTSVDNETIFSIGTDAADKTSSFKFDSSTTLNWFFSANDTKFNPQAQLNTWEHYVCVYDGGNVASSRRVWKNGVELSITSTSSSIDYLNLDSNASFRVANRSSLSQPAQCSISNFKLWNVALTAEEVAMEYALGRTGKSLNLTDTSLCLGGTVPRAQLDVRGSVVFDSGLVIKYKNSLEYARDGGIMLSRAGLGTITNKYSSQPIVLDGGDSSAIDGNIRGGAIWSQWGGAQYGIAMRGANYNDTYPYLQDPALFVTNDKIGINTASPSSSLDVAQVGEGSYIARIINTHTGNDQDARLAIETSSASGESQLIFITTDGSTKSLWHITADSGSTGDIGFYYSADDYNGGTSAGYITRKSDNVSLNFTGQHRTFIKNVPFMEAGDLEGLIVSADQNKYIKMSGGIAMGSNAITTNESLPVVSLSTKVNDKKCFGVVSTSEDPETREEKYGNFVSVSQKELGDTRVYINSVGEGAMWVTNINGPLESGDYITTSNVGGYGQRQDDDILHNYTVAKITMDCDFNPPDIPVQRIVKELSNVNYWVKTTVSNVSLEEYSNLAEENRTTEDETYYTKDVEQKFTYKPTVTVTADDAWDDVSIFPSDVTYAEWSNLEANVQNTYTLTYTQNDYESMRYEKTTVSNVTAEDAWDAVHIEPPGVTYAEYSNLEANVQNTYSLTYTKSVTMATTPAYYSNLAPEEQNTYTLVYTKTVTENVEADTEGADAHVRTIYKKIEREDTKEERDDEEWVLDVRQEPVNVLDEHGQLQWEDDPSGATEKAYKIRYLDASGQQTDEANCVHKAAFVGVTYHCG
jgi:hypothetical protein